MPPSGPSASPLFVGSPMSLDGMAQAQHPLLPTLDPSVSIDVSPNSGLQATSEAPSDDIDEVTGEAGGVIPETSDPLSSI